MASALMTKVFTWWETGGTKILRKASFVKSRPGATLQPRAFQLLKKPWPTGEM